MVQQVPQSSKNHSPINPSITNKEMNLNIDRLLFDKKGELTNMDRKLLLHLKKSQRKLTRESSRFDFVKQTDT